MSPSARSALLNAIGRVGAPVRHRPEVVAELRSRGLVSASGNVTRKGLYVREGLLDEQMTAL